MKKYVMKKLLELKFSDDGKTVLVDSCGGRCDMCPLYPFSALLPTSKRENIINGKHYSDCAFILYQMIKKNKIQEILD